MPTKLCLIPLLCVLSSINLYAEDWSIDSQHEWTTSLKRLRNSQIQSGEMKPTGQKGTFTSQIKRFPEKRQAVRITFEQSPVWQNWTPVENVGPSNLGDAPVLLCIEPGNYWMFGRYQGKAKADKHEAEPAELEGFDIPLMTTPFPNQFDAPGGLKPGAGGYHAWQSRDMVHWVHHGSVTEKFSVWVTTAEYADGKTFIYYDYPNDQDPHLYIDDDLTDGEPGRNMGIAFKDPSHGSDCGIIRSRDGKFHVIYEDWSPINARTHSWDSPLAGHAVSEDGIGDFKILPPAIDNRTEPTGEVAEYEHPHWLQHPDWDSNIAKYNVHEPEQEAYGDWAPISVGGRYYLFGDYDPVGRHSISLGWFTSPSLDEPFTWCDHIGKGHPDPDIGFAEGKFHLVTQQQTDYVSPGPWVEQVEARVGVDTDNNGEIDQWTEWRETRETYSQLEGFAKQIEKTPATINLRNLPAGHGYQFEFRVTDTTENKSLPTIDAVTLTFD